jgi:hypothetical protein
VKKNKAAHAAQIVQRVQLWRESSMDAQELLVHHRRERQVAERFHAGVVNGFRVLVLA